jgi:hypothetical protein
MRRLILLAASACAFAVMPVLPTHAAPSAPAPFTTAPSSSDIVLVKGGHGRGHGFGRHGGHRAYGWSRGKKVGWRGRGCPPGLWKQGRC